MTRDARIEVRWGIALGIVAALALAGCLGFGDSDSEGDPQLAEVREGASSYEDLAAAQQDGYVQFSLRIPGMGVHYLQGSAIGDDGTSDLDRSLALADPEILVYVEDQGEPSDRRLVAAEYAVPVDDGETTPPQQAVDLFAEADASDWHAHPSRHELQLGPAWTIHAECHYEGGPGVFLAEDPNGTFVRLTPEGQVGTWSGTVGPDQCPDEAGGEDLGPLLIVHEKWWTLHAWAWFDNPDGVFHPTNPRVGR